MANPLDNYRIGYSASFVGGTPPANRTFAQLGVTACKIVSAAGGGDYADITCDVSLADGGMPFLPLAKHTIFDPAGNVRFIGWLSQPNREADASVQQQKFRLVGPSYWLDAIPYEQQWKFASNPAAYDGGELAAQLLSRHILFFLDGEPVPLRAQVQAILDYAKDHDAPIDYQDIAQLPVLQPMEDEQTDRKCGEALARCLRWAPLTSAAWVYPSSGNPKLKFVGANASTHTIITNDGSLKNFRCDPRYDLLVKKLTVRYVSEQEVARPEGLTDDDGPQLRIWMVLSEDVSEASNGSIKTEIFTYDLRGASIRRNPDGTPKTAAEAIPTGIAAALHAPFKTLTCSLQWSTDGEDVDWSTSVGMVVDVRRKADDGAEDGVALISYGVTARSAIQQISRDLVTGTTAYTAGPPAHLGINDLIALQVAGSRSRNAARNGGGGGGGYTVGYGPRGQDSGEKDLPGSGGGGGTGSSAGMLQPFQLLDASDAGTHPGRVRLTQSTLYGAIPSGPTTTAVSGDSTGFSFGDSPAFYLIITGDQYVYARTTFSISPLVSGGQPVLTRTIQHGAVLPDNSPSTGVFIDLIGTVSVSGGVPTVSNARFGPIEGNCLVDWFFLDGLGFMIDRGR